MKSVTFKYMNHRGEIAQRTITPDAIEFIGFSASGYQPGWFLSGKCHDKGARRSFALSRIIFENNKDDAFTFALRLQEGQ